MGCDREKVIKLILIGTIVVSLVTGATPVVMRTKAVNDTVSVTFTPSGNLSVSVTPTTWDAETLYADQSNETSGNHFTADNDGTVTWATAYIQAANSPDMTLVDSSPANNEFAMQAQGGDLLSFTGLFTNQTLETNVAYDSNVQFDLKVIMGPGFTDDWGQQTCVVTITVVDT